MKKETKDLWTIINKELEIWKEAYPKNKKVLEGFANKIKIEIGNEKRN